MELNTIQFIYYIAFKSAISQILMEPYVRLNNIYQSKSASKLIVGDEFNIPINTPLSTFLVAHCCLCTFKLFI